MFINSLMDLAPITPIGSKVMLVEELNDFADNGRMSSFWKILSMDSGAMF